MAEIDPQDLLIQSDALSMRLQRDHRRGSHPLRRLEPSQLPTGHLIKELLTDAARQCRDDSFISPGKRTRVGASLLSATGRLYGAGNRNITESISHGSSPTQGTQSPKSRPLVKRCAESRAINFASTLETEGHQFRIRAIAIVRMIKDEEQAEKIAQNNRTLADHYRLLGPCAHCEAEIEAYLPTLEERRISDAFNGTIEGIDQARQALPMMIADVTPEGHIYNAVVASLETLLELKELSRDGGCADVRNEDLSNNGELSVILDY